jgi:plastocyanin
LTVIMSLIAIVALAITFVPTVEQNDTDLGLPATGVALGVAAIALVVLAVKWDPDDAANDSTAGGTTGIAIQGFEFNGGTPVTVAAGSTVTWTNDDSTPHSVLAEDAPPTFVSDTLGKGQTFAFTFDKPGTFSYQCGIHPNMKGTITVTP